MRTLALLALALLWPASVFGQAAQPITFAWDASAFAAGYQLTVDSTSIDVGPPTQKTVPVSTGSHVATVRAYNAIGIPSGPSTPPLVFTVQEPFDPACATPFGNRSIAIFVTNLQTGTGKPLSKAFLTFQVASPNSPITHLAVRSKGADLPQGTMDGGPPAYLNASPGLWFLIPATPGVYPLSVRATNLYGCTTDLLTSKTVTVP